MSRSAHLVRSLLSAAALALSTLSAQAAVIPDCSSGTCLVNLANVTITFVGTSSWVDEPALEIIQNGATVGFSFDPEGHYELHSNVPVDITHDYELHYLPAVRFDARPGYQVDSLYAELEVRQSGSGGGISSLGTTFNGQYGQPDGRILGISQLDTNQIDEMVYGFAGGISSGLPPYPPETWGSVVFDATRYLVTVELSGTAAAVPEPATLGLFALGALGLAAARRCRKAD